MKIGQTIFTLDVHAAGWPLRVAMPLVGTRAGESPSRLAERLWREDRPPVRWLQKEPRGHAFMRIGVLVPSSSADAVLLAFDADGPCRPDGLDALCAAAVLEEEMPSAERETTAAGWKLEAAESSWSVRRGPPGTASPWLTVSGGTASLSEAILPVRLEDGRELSVDVADSGDPYVVADAGALGLKLDIRSIPELERAARMLADAIVLRRRGEETLRPRVVFTQGMPTPRDAWKLAVAGRDGKLLRAPEYGAVGACLSAVRRKQGGQAPDRIVVAGLSGGTVEVRVTGDPHVKGVGVAWELSAPVFVTGAMQFVADPDDPLAEGFLLR